LVVTDKAGNSSEVKKFELTWDTTDNSVEDFKAVVAGDGKVDLSWTDPEDEDLAGLEIFRSTEEGVLGESLEKVKTGVGKYVDSLVIPGQTYYYTVVAIDELGNKSEENAQLKIVLPVLATVTTEPTTPVAPTQEVTTYSTPKKVAETPVTPEVKGGNTNEAKGDEKKEDDNSRTLSAFGIGLLAVLALVGLYLLYLQNPDWFAGLAFWKKKQVKKNGKKLKR
jgi:hypothetical protein